MGAGGANDSDTMKVKKSFKMEWIVNAKCLQKIKYEQKRSFKYVCDSSVNGTSKRKTDKKGKKWTKQTMEIKLLLEKVKTERIKSRQ